MCGELGGGAGGAQDNYVDLREGGGREGGGRRGGKMFVYHVEVPSGWTRWVAAAWQ